MVAILALGFAPLLWQSGRFTPSGLSLGVLRVALLTQLYFVWHLLFAGLAPELRPASPLALSFVMFCFITLYLMQVLLCLYPKSRLSLWLYPWVYHGFILMRLLRA